MALKKCKYCNNEFKAFANLKTCSTICSDELKKLRKNKYESDYRNQNKDIVLKKKRKYYQDNKIRLNCLKKEYNKKRHLEDIEFKLKSNLRSRLNQAIKTNTKAGSAISDLGCSIAELKEHLERQFQDGMSWDNWTIDGWHIDHIIPLANFDLTNKEELKKACHYANLQPLWAKDNLKKRY